MARLFKNSFVWQFAGGFLIGAAGLAAVHSAQPEMSANPYAPSHIAR